MNFTTKIPIPKSNHPIDYHSKIVSLGSCFVENMGDKLEYYKFKNLVNPFGIVFNPVTIADLISRVVNYHLFTEKDVFFHNERWHSFDVHSDLNNESKEAFLEIANQLLQSTMTKIAQSTHMIITFGTSWIYRLKTSNQVVANCHKVPQNQFQKEILSVSDIEKSIHEIIGLIQKVNPNCKIIFTVSPVRHIKDGFIENQRSKSHLITALHQVVQSEFYFPSYEIVMDELRDYRFYAEDMLHPSKTAIDYIWERFSETYISDMSQEVMEEVDSVQEFCIDHSIPILKVILIFKLKLEEKIYRLVAKHPSIKF